jgi:Domain of unknown function (DUF1996)
MPRLSPSHHLRVAPSHIAPRHAKATVGQPEGPQRTRRRRFPAPVLGVLGLVVAVAAVGLPLRANALRQSEAVWSVKCAVTHSAPDDPIVFPAQPGQSHLHDFFGNVSVDANSTTRTLANAGSSCIHGMDQVDHAAYWTPALLNGGRPVASSPADLRIDAYYMVLDKPVPVQPMPFGLRMIAGDSKAQAPQPTKIVHYNCIKLPNGGQVTSDSAAMPTCPAGSYVSAKIVFPGCWDGKNLDSADHKSHMAYPVRNACPASHPVRLPTLGIRLRWKMAEALPAGRLSLSSGGQYSMHADFWNTWSPPAMQWLVTNCLNAIRNCRDITRDQIAVPNSPFPTQDALQSMVGQAAHT